jgi:hypothetical protein
MRQRCTNTHRADYKNWGGRGITFCKRWESFENFLEDMGKKPTSDHSLDRIDNMQNYCKENCRWSDSVDQNNNRRDNIKIEITIKKELAHESIMV